MQTSHRVLHLQARMYVLLAYCILCIQYSHWFIIGMCTKRHFTQNVNMHTCTHASALCVHSFWGVSVIIVQCTEFSTCIITCIFIILMLEAVYVCLCNYYMYMYMYMYVFF